MPVEFKKLHEVEPAKLIALMNNASVIEHMPLSSGGFNEAACKQFLLAKESLWNEHGYGPWGFFVDGQFAGWGGLQPENRSPDLALVLHPSYWGHGLPLYREIVRRGFEEMGFDHITALLPPTRTRLRALSRLGFVPSGQLSIDGQTFLRFRLDKPNSDTVEAS